MEIWLRAAERPDIPDATPELPQLQPVEKERLKVLAVDDDTLVLFNTVAMLEELGHEPLEAHSGSEALAILEKQKVDVVVTDHAMPKMTGLELRQLIAQRWPETRVIIATGYAELPGTDHRQILSKPFTEAQLASALAPRQPN